MYTEYFGLRESPFSIAPDPRYLYMSEKHREALAHLMYGIKGDGFILLTGEVGTGKTTVCRCLLGQLPENADIAFVFYPKLTVRELFATICDELRIPYPRANASNKDMLDRINTYLLDAHARGRKTVVIIEEAQNLNTELLEQVRLLTNLETDKQKLLQIIMVGQPELRDVLARPEMKQVAQRITARYHLGPLSREEVAAYISHRLAVAGGRAELFSRSAINKIFIMSGGVPRVVNLLCDRSLLGAYSQGKKSVDRSTVVRAAREVFGAAREARPPVSFKRVATAVLVTLICGAALSAVYYTGTAQPVVSKKAVPANKAQIQKAHIPKKHVEEATLEWPSAQPIGESGEMAYRALFRQWSANYQGGAESACSVAVSSGLRCLKDNGSLDMLVRLNRPAVLTMFDPGGRKYYASLISLHGDEATFALGLKTVKIDIHRLQRWWFGDFTMLWRVPPHYRGDIKPGDRGQSVKWLARELSRALAKNVEAGASLVYNNEMLRQVKKFQLANGLTPDGIVGPRTMILLNSGRGDRVATLDGRKVAK